MSTTSNCQPIMPKSQPNQSIFCPWISRAPLATTPGVKQDQKSTEQQAFNNTFGENSEHCQSVLCNNYQQMKSSTPSIQQSSAQFFNFLRLMQLFPDVHPATLHTVLVLCKSDFFCAVDKLLYAKRCKQMYNSRRNSLQSCNANIKCSRYQPYCYVAPVNSVEVTNNRQTPSTTLVIQGLNAQLMPLDASIKKIQKSCNESNVPGLKVNLSETRKFYTKNAVKTKAASIDLPSLNSPTYKLPICPLSPASSLPEDLSNQCTDKNNKENCSKMNY